MTGSSGAPPPPPPPGPPMPGLSNGNSTFDRMAANSFDVPSEFHAFHTCNLIIVSNQEDIMIEHYSVVSLIGSLSVCLCIHHKYYPESKATKLNNEI